MSLPAVIELDFEPLLSLDELRLPWQAVGLTLAVVLAVALAAQARAEPRASPRASPRATTGFGPRSGRQGQLTGRRATIEAAPLRLDDLAYILLAALPGAVIGGRVFHVVAFWDFYAVHPELMLEPASGSLSLLGAVVGGSLTGAWMARLLAAPVRRWADVAAVPLLLALGLGKLSQLLAGSGQGLPFDGPWAVAFSGEGPWTSASPAMPSHPAQAYEGIWLLIGAFLLLSVASAVRSRPARHGLLFVLALAIFLLGRVLVGFTWRDERLLGALNAEQLLALGVLGLLVLSLLVALAVGAGRARYRGGVQELNRAAPSREEPRP